VTEQLIKRGILQSFSASMYTASVLILEATSYVLDNVPIATCVDGTSALIGASCVVLFLDAQNPTDAVIIAVYGSAPVPTPGRVTFVTPILQVNAATINAGNINTYALNGIPANTLGVLCHAFFSSANVGAWIGFAPHGGSIGSYWVLGNEQVANQSVNGNALLPVDASGQIDVKANTGNCVVTLYTYGYVF
jgi:hypothetical protein